MVNDYTPEQLKQIVFEAMSNGKENGVAYSIMTTREIAEDLIYCDSDLEMQRTDALIALITEWQIAHEKQE